MAIQTAAQADRTGLSGARRTKAKSGRIMIKIALIDDEREERERLSGYFRRLREEVKDEFLIRTFVSGNDFLEQQEEIYDLICLDIDMEGRDGISTAQEIRKNDDNVLIIFVTNMAQMAIRGYEVHALDFVVKPVNYYSFAMKMNNAFHIIENRKSRNIVLTTPGGMQRISTDELYYVEVAKHYLFYHTKDGVFRQKASMKELEDRLAGLSFKRCNNCYLVNLKYVNCVNKDDLQVGGDWLKISRPRKKEFLQALANYMGGVEL